MIGMLGVSSNVDVAFSSPGLILADLGRQVGSDLNCCATPRVPFSTLTGSNADKPGLVKLQMVSCKKNETSSNDFHQFYS